MSYAILRHGKIKAPQLGAAVAHNHRTSSVEKVNIDAALTPLNAVMKGVGTVGERVAGKLRSLGTKVRKDAVVAIELVLSASPEWFNELHTDRAKLTHSQKFKQWANESVAWARKEFGGNIVDISVHLDESSPHMHVLAVPLTKDGRLCAKEILARSELTRRQDSYAKAMEPLGMQRGLSAKETKRRHIKLTEEPSGSGGRTSALAAQLAKAQAEVTKLQARLERQQRISLDFSAKLTELENKLKTREAELADAKRMPETESPGEPKNRALDAFLAEHAGLARASPSQASVGTPVAVCERFVVLHVGRGRHVLHEVPPGRPMPELARSSPGIGR